MGLIILLPYRYYKNNYIGKEQNYVQVEEYIPKRLTELCSERGVSKYWLAQKSGIGQSTLAQIFAQKCTPTIYTLDKICSALNISLEQFFSNEKYSAYNDIPREIIDTWDRLGVKERALLCDVVASLKREYIDSKE